LNEKNIEMFNAYLYGRCALKISSTCTWKPLQWGEEVFFRTHYYTYLIFCFIYLQWL